jgi:formamidopyrimidine-DNA glycosylase
VPELPEVETIRAALERVLAGKGLVRVRIADPRLTRPEPPEAIAAALEGDRVTAVRRRGKYVVIELESLRHLLVHLRMTGSFLHGRNGSLEEDQYQRAVVTLDDGSDVGYRDVRRFGTWLLLESGELDGYLASRLGLEPLDREFTPRRLRAALDGRRAPIKAALLDQRIVAGIGNIYADEALWEARVHPLRPAGELAGEDVARLHRAIRKVLAHAIDRGGATLDDRNYRDPSGREGSMQDEFRVYGREGKPCPRCRAAIAKKRIGGRGTCFCPRCQAPPRP